MEAQTRKPQRHKQAAYFIYGNDSGEDVPDIDEGWRREADGTLVINPAIYSVQIEDVFRRPKRYQTFRAQLALRLLQLKYKFIRQWLELDRADTISQQIRALDKLDAAADLDARDAQIRAAIYKRYGP